MMLPANLASDFVRSVARSRTPSDEDAKIICVSGRDWRTGLPFGAVPATPAKSVAGVTSEALDPLSIAEQLPITLGKIGVDTVQTVDARRIWEYLDRPWGDFSDWFRKSIAHCQLTENIDYILLLGKQEQRKDIIGAGSGGGNRKDYALSLDAAKEIVMIDRGELGKAARVYFIAAERQLRRSMPIGDNELMARAFLVAHKTIDALTHKVEELEPKARALDTLSAAEGTRCVTTAWKELGLPGKKSRHRFFLYLQELGWIFRRGNRNYEGYADAIKRGLIDNEMMSYEDPNDGIKKTKIEVKITSKGMTKLAGILGVQKAAARTGSPK